MPKRYQFKKITEGFYALCWWCGNFNTHYAIIDFKTGEDFFCCIKCAIKRYKIKTLKKYSVEQRRAILKSNSYIKEEEKMIPLVVC